MVHRHIKPGGYIYLHEYDVDLFSDDGTYTDKLSLFKYYALVNEAAAKSGEYICLCWDFPNSWPLTFI